MADPVSTAVQGVDTTTLAGSIAKIDFSMWGMFMQADWIVKSVMILLVLASFWCWAIIFEKFVLFRNIKAKAVRFESDFWSSEALDKFYEKSKKRVNHPMAVIFVAAMEEWFRSKNSANQTPQGLRISLRERIVQVMMVARNREVQRTDFTVSVDAADGIATGISATDRTRTIRILADPEAHADQLVQPGHVFPLRARPGGVLERAGHTEAAVDLAVLAGLHPSGVLCELVNDDGTVQRLPELTAFKAKFGLKMISIAQLIEYRAKREQLVEHVCTQPFPSEFGEFTAQVFRSRLDGRSHLALVMGELTAEPTLVRVHSENLLSDVFQAKGMTSHHALMASMQAIAHAGRGVVLYMEPANMGELLVQRLQAKPGALPLAMGLRDYGTGAQILRALGLAKIRLLSGSQRKVVGLDGYGLEIVEQVNV